MRLTAVDADADRAVERLLRQAPFLSRSCEVRPCSVPVGEPGDVGLADLLVEGPPPDRVYVCCDDDDVALRVGLRVLRAQGVSAARVVVCVERGAAFSTAFHQERLFDDARGTLRILAVMELVLTPDRIRGSLGTEQLARALHAAYLEGCVGQGKERPRSRPALMPWDELPEDLKESNRDQARHIGEKLAAIGCVLVPHFDPAHAFSYVDEEEVMKLAQLEHVRWMREKLAIGIVPGAVKTSRTHPDLVDWADLSELARDKDALFIRELPRVLEDAGYQVLRLARMAG
jgi:hypothetical protein